MPRALSLDATAAHTKRSAPDAASLLAFAQANRKLRGPRCWMCCLPAELLATIHAARRDDPAIVTYPSIADWLQEHGYPDAKPGRVRDHFLAHVKDVA